MADNSKIEWTDHTFNPWIGCTAISPACLHCYAEDMANRYHWAEWGPGKPRKRTSEANWKKPLTWHRNSRAFMEKHGRRQRVFCASLADVFDNEVDPQWRVDLFDLIEMTPSLDWLLLTKRIGNVDKMVKATKRVRLPRNVWLGATIANREEMLRDGPKLKEQDATIRFWSVEPMLDDLGFIQTARFPDWIIAGGESGPGARPSDLKWFRFLRDQCEDVRVPFLFKQWGEYDADGKRVGKKTAGRELDGRTHDAFPV